MGLRIADELFDATTPATEDLSPRIPKRKWQDLVLCRAIWLPMLAFGIFGAAMLAEPAVANVEEVIGLIQLERGAGG